MQWLLGVYTSRFNHRQKEFGHLDTPLVGGPDGAVRLTKLRGYKVTKLQGIKLAH
jgi:hypothetical protein